MPNNKLEEKLYDKSGQHKELNNSIKIAEAIKADRSLSHTIKRVDGENRKELFYDKIPLYGQGVFGILDAKMRDEDFLKSDIIEPSKKDISQLRALKKSGKELTDLIMGQSETQFINESNLDFTDISSEQYRIYEFNNGKTVMITEPLKLNISKNGGHRIYDASGISHYIPQGWLHLSWRAKPNQPNFVK